MNLERLFENIVKHKFVYGSVGLQIVGIILGSILCWQGALLYLSVGFLILYSLFTVWYQLNLNKQMVSINEYRNHEEILYSTLNNVLEDHDLNHEFYENLIENSSLPILEQIGVKHDPSFRFSLYIHSGDCFVLRFRYSDDPTFKKKGRAIYPDNEGIIGEAYHRNGYEILDLPDPIVNEDKWIQSHLNSGKIKERKTIENLTMKSRNLVAIPIRHGNNKHVIAVFESIEPQKLRLNRIQKILSSPQGLHLQNTLSKYRLCLEPSLNVARKMRI